MQVKLLFPALSMAHSPLVRRNDPIGLKGPSDAMKYLSGACFSAYMAIITATASLFDGNRHANHNPLITV